MLVRRIRCIKSQETRVNAVGGLNAAKTTDHGHDVLGALLLIINVVFA